MLNLVNCSIFFHISYLDFQVYRGQNSTCTSRIKEEIKLLVLNCLYRVLVLLLFTEPVSRVRVLLLFTEPVSRVRVLLLFTCTPLTHLTPLYLLQEVSSLIN